MTSPRRSLLLALMACLTSCGTIANAASFKCEKATSPVEKAICADPELSALDSYVDEVYVVAKEALEDGATCLQDDQAAWTTSVRDACGPHVVCLKKGYLERFGTLNAVPGGRQLMIPDVHLPTVPELITAIPPETEAPATETSEPVEFRGTLAHEQNDLDNMGYAVQAKDGSHVIVLDSDIGNSSTHGVLGQEIDEGISVLVRGLKNETGGVAMDACRFVYRVYSEDTEGNP